MASVNFDDILADETSVETPTEVPAARPAAKPAISFDDILEEEPAAALPVGPRVGERVPISAREPREPVRRVSIAEREPAEPDRSSALGDIAAGVKQAQQVIPGLQIAKGALDINEAEYEQARTESSKQRLSALDTALAELAPIVGPGAVRTRPKSQAEADARERMRGAYQDLMAQRQQLLLGIGSGDPTANIQSDLTRAQEEKQSAIKSVVEGAMEINRLSEDIAKIPINRQSEIFTQPYGDTTGEKLRSMWAALSSDPTGIARTFALRSMPASAPTIIASIVGGLGGPGGAAALAGLTGGSVEAGSSMAGYITDELQKKGIDPSNRAAVEKWAVENIDTVLDMVGKSAVRAGVIGVADAATGGASEAIARAVTGGSRIRQAVGTGVGGVVDALGEGAGEAAAQYATEGEVDLGEIGAEIIGGVPQGAATTGGQIIRQSIIGNQVVVTNDRSGGPDTEAALRATGTGAGTPPAASPAASTVDPDQAAAIAATQPPPAPTPAPPPAPTPASPPPAPAPAPAPPPPAPAPAPAPAPPPVAPVGPAAGPTQAPPAPATPTQAQRIREIALARQAAQQPVTAPPPEAGVAEGPQAGGLPAAPTTPPVTSEGSPPAPPPAPPKAEAPKRVRNFTSESAPDILHAAGLKTGEIATLKKGDQTRLTGLIRSALKAQYSPEELNSMPREEYNAAVAGIYSEIKAATAPKAVAPKAAPKPAAPPVAAAPAAEAPAAEAPVAEAPVSQPAPSITEAPSEGRVTKGSEISAEEKARLLAELNAKTAPKVTPKGPLTAEEVPEGERRSFPGGPKGEKIVEISEGRSGRVLKDESEQGVKKEAEAQAAAQALAAKQAAETKAAKERAAKLEQGPQGAKMNPVEVARRQANRTAATEIAQEFVPDNKSEKSFEDNTFEGNKAREAIRARAKRMVAAVEKRMSADEKGNKLPKSRKSSAKEEQALSPEILLLMEARDLAKTTTKTPSVQAVARFRSAEALLRSGMVDEYMASRRTDTDIANRKTPDLKTEEGESIDVAQTIVDTRSTPEEDLAAAQEGRPEEEDYTPDTDEPTQMPIERERPKLVSDEQVGKFYTTVTGAKKPPVVVVTRTGKALDKIAKERSRLLTTKHTPAERAKAVSELREMTKDAEGDTDTSPPEQRLRSKPPSDPVMSQEGGSKIPNLAKDPFYQLFIKKMLKLTGADKNPAAKYAVEVGSFSDMISRVSDENLNYIVLDNWWGNFALGEAQRDAVKHVAAQLNETIKDVVVYIVPDKIMDTVLDEQGASAFYGIDSDTIVLRESSLSNPNRFIWDLLHEGAHAALFAAVRSDPEIRKQLSIIAQAAERTALNLYGKNNDYGFTNLDEFLSEFLSNPQFAELLALTPMSRTAFEGADVSPPTKRKLRTALDYLKSILANITDLPAFYSRFFKSDTVPETALDHMMSVVDKLFDIAPQARTDYRNMSPKERDQWRNERQSAYDAFNKDKGRASVAYDRLRNDKKPLSNYNKLRAGGVPNDVAREINDFLKAEVGKTVDPATVPLLIADFITAFGQPKATTPAGNAPTTGGTQPPYQPPATPAMGPAAPIIPQPQPFRGKDSKWKRRLGRLALKNMTLDFMRQKHGDKFVDKKGNILKQIIESVQKRDNLALEFAKPINEITAEFTDLIKSNPKEAMELADLAMEATRLDVRLGRNADNSHLGKNKATGLQGKKRLAALNQRFLNDLSDVGRDIYSRLTTAYRDAHNQNMEALVYNILAELPQKLSTGDVMYLMGKVTSGNLDANDAALVNDPIIFNGLKNAQGLKTIKGDYFPQMRFGNWVVKTRETLVDPGWTSVPMKQMRAVPGKPGQRRTVVTQLPARTEVSDNALRVIVDPTVRGAQTAAMRALRDHAAKQDLTLQGITTLFRDRQTGKLVSKGDQMIGRTYDTVYEARFQTDGVQFFDDEADAYKFRDSSPSNVTSEVLTRIALEQQSLPDGSVLGTIVKRINSDKRLSPGEKKLFDNVVKSAIIASMDGNSARSRYQARRNVKGASKDIARAAVTYGQAAGNFNATLQTAPDIRDGLERLEVFATEMSDKAGGGQVSDIAQELRDRMATIEGGNEPWKMMQNIATLSFLDKLLTPSHAIVNGLQPAGTTMPILAGRYGFGRANVALGNAYRKSGALDATVSGVKNSAIALKDIGRTAINTDDIIGSMRKNLGQEYEALIDRMLEVGAVSPDAGQEVASAIEASGGRVSNAIGRVDRFARQLPNAVEAINRVVTAVATYDLAKGKKSKQEAIQEAIDTVFNTQGDYRKKNAPRWMQHPSVSWALQFKKYGQMMYQLSVDMWHRSFKGANPEERKVARKQLAYLYLTQASMAGVFGLSGLEILKLGMQALALFGFPTWEEEEEDMRNWIEENTAWPISSIINNGLLSTVTQLDFAGRLGQGDLALGFLPKDMEKTDLYQYFGQVIAGAPGGTVVDWTQAGRNFAKGDIVKGLELMIPIKQVSDIIGTARGVAEGKLGPYEAAAKVVGFRSLETAEESRQTGADIRDFKQRKKIEKELYGNLREALANKDRAAEFKARKALRQYRKELDRIKRTEK